MPIVPVSGTDVYYLATGTGLPVLLIHGSGADHTLWGHQVGALRHQHAVAALDLNGHGKSPRRAGDGLRTYTEDVLAVIDELGEPAVVVGHSLGGAVALTVALESPHVLRGLGLVGTGARLRVHPEILSRVDRDITDAVDFITDWAFSQRPAAEMRGKARTRMLQNGRETLKRDFRTCDAFDMMDRLSEIRLRTLVLTGQADQLTPVKYAEYLRNHMPNAYLEVVEGAGHLVMLERPEAVNDAIRGLCRQVGQGGS